MRSSSASISQAQKLKALRRIEYALCHEAHPLARSCGLTEKELQVLESEQLIVGILAGNAAPPLDSHRISKILPAGLAILSKDTVPEPKSFLRKAYEKTRGGAWDLIKVAFGAVLGWYLKKYFP